MLFVNKQENLSDHVNKVANNVYSLNIDKFCRIFIEKKYFLTTPQYKTSKTPAQTDFFFQTAVGYWGGLFIGAERFKWFFDGVIKTPK